MPQDKEMMFSCKPSNRKINLSGYGVELAIKDTEYKAMDDTQVEATNSTDKSYDGIAEDVQGFYFDKLIQMYPDLKDNLVEFRKHLIESTNEMEPLKVWELQGHTCEVKTIPGDYLLKLFKRMPRVCKAVIKAKGGYFEEPRI
ncbi:unnamed protein product [Ranitomeya imitator]|uniref:Uncharacterized protein n=1 Tax=Ranitomeya imitator TaxID=111125 RepID=A0ABN9LX56_9NEOB|nr:unnamed protein product [Ranitomeya imitator]